MKTLRLIFLITIAALLLNSCDSDDDSYSLSSVWVGFGLTDDVNEESNTFVLKMDDGSVLYPTVTQVPWFDITANQRLLINYTIIGDKNVTNTEEEYYVRINSLKKILYKDIFEITPETEDSIGNDPIHVKDAWLTGSILTFELQYFGNSQTHYINLIKQPGAITAEDEPIKLELRHNNRNDAPYTQMTAFVSFKLDNIKIDGQNSVDFEVTGVDFNNTEYKDSGTFSYENN